MAAHAASARHRLLGLTRAPPSSFGRPIPAAPGYYCSPYDLFSRPRRFIAAASIYLNAGAEGEPIRATTTPCGATEMLCEIAVEAGCLRVELFNRQTADDTQRALAAITAAARKHGCSQIL